MNLREDIQQLPTGDRDLRKFGLTVGIVFTVLGGLLFLRHKACWPFFLWPGGVLLGLGLVAPRPLKYVYIVWMSAALAMGFVMARVILTLFFFLVVTPVGLVARLAGKDFLRLKRDPFAASYWIRREQKAKTPAEYERQY